MRTWLGRGISHKTQRNESGLSKGSPQMLAAQHPAPNQVASRRVEMLTLVSAVGRISEFSRACLRADSAHATENARLNCFPADWRRACILKLDREQGKILCGLFD